jgi:DNA-directed RNA polymerase specialized sigma subunit
MIDAERLDLAMLHAHNEVMETFKEFFMVYFGSRFPSPEEIAQQLNIPIELVIEAMSQEEEV